MPVLSFDCNQILFIEMLVARVLAMDSVQVRVTGQHLNLDEARKSAAPTVRLLVATIERIGNVVNDGTSTRSEFCSRIRLAAMIGMLDLCGRPGLCAFLYEDWSRYILLALCIQDSCVEVRSQVRWEWSSPVLSILSFGGEHRWPSECIPVQLQHYEGKLPDISLMIVYHQSAPWCPLFWPPPIQKPLSRNEHKGNSFASEASIVDR